MPNRSRSHLVEEPRQPIVRRVVLGQVNIAQRRPRLLVQPNRNRRRNPKPPHLRIVPSRNAALLAHHIRANRRTAQRVPNGLIAISRNPALLAPAELSLHIHELLPLRNLALLVHHSTSCP